MLILPLQAVLYFVFTVTYLAAVIIAKVNYVFSLLLAIQSFANYVNYSLAEHMDGDYVHNVLDYRLFDYTHKNDETYF